MAEQLRNRFMKCNDEVYSDTLIKFIPSDFRGRILCLFIGDLITEAAIAEKLPDADIYVADLPQFGFEAFDPNLHKLNFEFTPGKAYTESELVTEIQGMFEGLKMKFDYVLINPPFSLGNAVATECLKHSDKIVCLMPLSKYKKGKLWSKITQFSLADPKLFTDACINENLSICRLSNTEASKYKDIKEFELDSFDQDLRLVYEWNQNHSIFSERSGVELESSLIRRGTENKTWFALGVRAPKNGVADKGGWDYKWNHKTEDTLTPCSNGLINFIFYKMSSEKAKDNLTTWYYHSRAKDCLANRLLCGLNRDGGTVEVAIPQIDFSIISETDLWKQNRLDEAVLDAMNLRMVEGKIVPKE